jgi:hypothetical protein
MLEIL